MGGICLITQIVAGGENGEGKWVGMWGEVTWEREVEALMGFRILNLALVALYLQGKRGREEGMLGVGLVGSTGMKERDGLAFLFFFVWIVLDIWLK